MVLTGPGGVGKGTVCAALQARFPQVAVATSATTRPPRPGERDGAHYYFLTEDAFDAAVEAGRFLEWAVFGGHRYGTLQAEVAASCAAGRTVVLEIDVQGARQVAALRPDAVRIFLAPPDAAALARRLEQRGADDPDRIAERLELAREELAAADEFDHVVVNDDVPAAVTTIASILGLAAAQGSRDDGGPAQTGAPDSGTC